jgi:glycosyltransferase involved in cell wall biosynthesis
MTQRGKGLRVAILIGSDGPGGAEMMVFRLAGELRERGCHVVPVLPAGGFGWLGGLLRGAGFEPCEVRITTRWIDVACVRALMRVFREHRIDVVHSHEFDMALLGAVAARLSGVPQVVTFHGGTTATRTFKRRAAIRWAMRRSASAVAVSAATAQRFAADLGLPERAFVVIPNGVPVREGDATAVRAEFGCRRDDIVLLAVGTLETNKGHRVLLEALTRLYARGDAPPWRLIIAGGRGGDQHEPLLAYVREHALESRVHIVTNRNDIPDLLALADIFVMPSFLEGLPMALLEAMVAGKAIVASATGGIPELVEHERHGLLVPPGDVTALTGALNTLMRDGVRRGVMGASAAARARGGFTAAAMAERYLELFRAAGTG